MIRIIEHNGNPARLIVGDNVHDQAWYLSESKVKPLPILDKDGEYNLWYASKPETLKDTYCKYAVIAGGRVEHRTNNLVDAWNLYRQTRIYNGDNCYIVNRETGKTYRYMYRCFVSSWFVK